MLAAMDCSGVRACRLLLSLLILEFVITDVGFSLAQRQEGVLSQRQTAYHPTGRSSSHRRTAEHETEGSEAHPRLPGRRGSRENGEFREGGDSFQRLQSKHQVSGSVHSHKGHQKLSPPLEKNTHKDRDSQKDSFGVQRQSQRKTPREESVDQEVLDAEQKTEKLGDSPVYHGARIIDRSQSYGDEESKEQGGHLANKDKLNKEKGHVQRGKGPWDSKQQRSHWNVRKVQREEHEGRVESNVRPTEEVSTTLSQDDQVNINPLLVYSTYIEPPSESVLEEDKALNKKSVPISPEHLPAKNPTNPPVVSVMDRLYGAIHDGLMADQDQQQSKKPKRQPSATISWFNPLKAKLNGSSFIEIGSGVTSIDVAENYPHLTVIAVLVTENATAVSEHLSTVTKRGLRNIYTCQVSAQELRIVVSKLCTQSEVLFGHLMLSDLLSFSEDLLPHEFEELLGRLFSLAREVFVAKPHDASDSGHAFLTSWPDFQDLLQRATLAAQLSGSVAKIQQSVSSKSLLPAKAEDAYMVDEEKEPAKPRWGISLSTNINLFTYHIIFRRIQRHLAPSVCDSSQANRKACTLYYVDLRNETVFFIQYPPTRPHSKPRRVRVVLDLVSVPLTDFLMLKPVTSTISRLGEMIQILHSPMNRLHEKLQINGSKLNLTHPPKENYTQLVRGNELLVKEEIKQLVEGSQRKPAQASGVNEPVEVGTRLPRDIFLASLKRKSTAEESSRPVFRTQPHQEEILEIQPHDVRPEQKEDDRFVKSQRNAQVQPGLEDPLKVVLRKKMIQLMKEKEDRDKQDTAELGAKHQEEFADKQEAKFQVAERAVQKSDKETRKEDDDREDDENAGNKQLENEEQEGDFAGPQPEEGNPKPVVAEDEDGAADHEETKDNAGDADYQNDNQILEEKQEREERQVEENKGGTRHLLSVSKEDAYISTSFEGRQLLSWKGGFNRALPSKSSHSDRSSVKKAISVDTSKSVLSTAKTTSTVSGKPTRASGKTTEPTNAGTKGSATSTSSTKKDAAKPGKVTSAKSKTTAAPTVAATMSLDEVDVGPDDDEGDGVTPLRSQESTFNKQWVLLEEHFSTALFDNFSVLAYGGLLQTLIAAKVAHLWPNSSVLLVIRPGDKEANKAYKNLRSSLKLNNLLAVEEDFTKPILYNLISQPDIVHFQIIGRELFGHVVTMGDEFIVLLSKVLSLAHITFVEVPIPQQLALSTILLRNRSHRPHLQGLLSRAAKMAGENARVHLLSDASEETDSLVVKVSMISLSRQVSCDCDGVQLTLELYDGEVWLDGHRLGRALQAFSLSTILYLGLQKPERKELFRKYLMLPLHEDMCPRNVIWVQGNLRYHRVLGPASDASDQSEMMYNQLKKSALLEILKSEVDRHKPWSLLEHGSKEGNTAISLSQLYPNSTFVSLEPSPKLARLQYNKLEAQRIRNVAIGRIRSDAGLAKKLLESPDFLRYQIIGMPFLFDMINDYSRADLNFMLGALPSTSVTTFLQLPSAQMMSLATLTFYPDLFDGHDHVSVQKHSFFLDDHPFPVYANAEVRMVGESARSSSNTSIKTQLLRPTYAPPNLEHGWRVLRIDLTNLSTQVNHHFDYAIDGHDRKYTQHCEANGTHWRVFLVRQKDGFVIPYEKVEGVSLIALLRLGLLSDIKDHLYEEFIHMPLYEDMAPWNIIFNGGRLEYIDYDTKDMTFDKMVPAAYQIMSVLMNYERTVKDFGRCKNEQAKTQYGFPYMGACVGSQNHDKCQDSRYPVPCGDQSCRSTYIECLRALLLMEKKKSKLTKLVIDVGSEKIPLESVLSPSSPFDKGHWSFGEKGYIDPSTVPRKTTIR